MKMSSKWLDQFVTSTKSASASTPSKSTNRFAALAVEETKSVHHTLPTIKTLPSKTSPLKTVPSKTVVDISSNSMFPVLSPLTAVPGPGTAPGKHSFATVVATVAIPKPPVLKETKIVPIVSEHSKLGVVVVSDDWGDYMIADNKEHKIHDAYDNVW